MEKTLLDEFAMAAMQAHWNALNNTDVPHGWSNKSVAESSYQLALAMMEERKKHIEAEDDGWIEWSGGIDPVKRDQLVEVIFRDGTKMSDECEVFLWNHDGSSGDIIKFRVLK